MSKKNFRKAPSPKNIIGITDDDISAYEKTGIGHDKKPHTHISTDEGEKLSRISVDIPKSLHTKFKTYCCANETTMVFEIQSFIEDRVQD